MDFNVLDYMELYLGSLKIIYYGRKYFHKYWPNVKSTKEALKSIEPLIENDSINSNDGLLSNLIEDTVSPHKDKN